MRKILFSVCGVGLGHATRIHSIINDVRKSARYRIAAAESTYDYFRHAKMHPVKLEGFDFFQRKFTFSLFLTVLNNIKFPIALTKNYMMLSKIIDRFRPNLIINDSEPASLLIAKNRCIKNYLLTNWVSTLDELKYIPRQFFTRPIKFQIYLIRKLMNRSLKYSTRVIAPSFDLNKPRNPKISNVGAIIRQVPEQVDEINTISDFYLVTFGGSNVGKIPFKMLVKILKKYRDKRFVFTAPFVERKRRASNILELPLTEKYLSYLKACNGVISLAGHSSISEILVFKKPSLIIPVRNHIEQLANANYVQRKGLASALISKKFNEKLLKKKIDDFFWSERKIQRNVERANVDGDGSRRVRSIIMRDIR